MMTGNFVHVAYIQMNFITFVEHMDPQQKCN